MSEDNKKTSQVNNKKKKKHRKHHFAVLPYIITPLIFVLISLIFVIPVCNGLMHAAINTVHTAQETFSLDYNDLSADNSYIPSDKESGAATISDIYVCKKIGVITCDNAGLNTDVYFGINRVSLRNGAACKSNALLPGQSGEIDVFGYSSTAFKALKNVKADDTIKFETSWGIYKYNVTSVEITSNPPKTSGEMLVLAASNDNKAFSNFNNEKLYVTAELISGPVVKEVQQ